MMLDVISRSVSDEGLNTDFWMAASAALMPPRYRLFGRVMTLVLAYGSKRAR